MNFKDSHQPGYLVQANNARYQYYSGLLKYKRTFAEVHNIDAMFGISAEKWVNKKVVTVQDCEAMGRFFYALSFSSSCGIRKAV